MEVDPIFGDPDMLMRGAYHEGSPSDQPPTSTTDVVAEPTVRPWTQQAPARFQDILPEPPRAIPASLRLPAVYLLVTNPLKTALNSFGLFRQYLFHPSHDPDATVDPSDLLNLTTQTLSPPPPSRSEDASHDPPWPFANISIWRMMQWLNTGSSSKSEGEVNCLVDDVLNAPDFRAEDLHNFNARRENSRLDDADKATPLGDGFQTASITIEVPTGQPTDPSTSCTYLVPGLRYWKLVNVIKAAFQSPLSQQFHFTPFTLMHQSPITNEEQRVYGELYNSDEFINEHKRVQNRSPPPPDDPGCRLEKVVAALMFWSDSTHLTNFGVTKLWPIYLFFGNLSKYIRSRPSSGACNHLAYIPSVCIPNIYGMCSHPHILQLPDSFESWISSWHPRWDTQRSQLMAHCRRELIHAIWKYILDVDFIHAMKYGVVVVCHDGIKRRIYPRIFTYSADYPEKWVKLFLN